LALSWLTHLDCRVDPGYDGEMSETEMSSSRQILEGTWEEIAQQADRLAGKRVRVEVLENGQADAGSAALPFYATATPEERAQAILEWGRSHAPRDAPPLSDEAISRESIYFGERD
jgi:hypothetical protein